MRVGLRSLWRGAHVDVARATAKLLLLWCGADSVAVACAEILHRDLSQRSCQETSFGDLVQRLATEILTKGTYLGSLAHDLLHVSLQRDLA